MARNADFVWAIEWLGGGLAVLTTALLLIVLRWDVELLRVLAWFGVGGAVLVLGGLVVLLLQWVADLKRRR